MKHTLAKDMPVAGFRISENEQKRLELAKQKLGLKNVSETIRLFVKQGVDGTLGDSK